MLSNRARLVLKTVLFTALAGVAAGGALGLMVLFGGWYNIGATKQHFPMVYTVLEQGMRYSVQHHAQDVKVPALGAPQQLRLGAALYRDNCAQCHGGPGVAQARIGMSMQPVPGPLSDATVRWKARELYWITRHGVKMSGMPAWEVHLDEGELWAVVAFVSAMPGMSARDYRRLTALREEETP
ncbi:cytochrome c [Massilia sp. ST3]|uniref:c-type cytochrome n=1 Tax=Massilia sp. ST3 TaxID=2824903 RepID=UPI001B82A6AB|nr:cytochrome c [Massilia sp. ST3]MBQ5946331.1 cytochrome c [Massilia sp. ST3]